MGSIDALKSGSKSMGEEKRQKRGCSKTLSDEAIEHIILRLPPPALVRFRCVSVQWRRRLSKPSSIDRYKSRNFSLRGKAEASTDDEYHRLSGPSTFLNGSLHWLLEPYGIVAFRLRENKLFFWWHIHIPGDKEYCKNNGRFCGCISKIREGGCYSNGECSCRYLGEVRNQLVYIRVTGDFILSMWILENYFKNVWSHTRRIVVGNMLLSLPSLFLGRVLAFDRTDARVLYLRVKWTVFSYNIVSREANKIFEIRKDYSGEDNCLDFLIPYEFPRIPLSVWHQPLTVQESRGICSNTGGTTATDNYCVRNSNYRGSYA
ncbi:hypothetical protein LguiA_018009 [Lonicera macranthoides]